LCTDGKHINQKEASIMKPVLLAGTIIVQFALIFYAVGIIIEQRRKIVTRAVAQFLSLGVVFDITATLCMIAGTDRSLFTFHGILGYSSLVVMVTDTVLLLRHRSAKGEEQVTRGLHLYSRLAYVWWIVAYVTGAALVMASHR
jgi:hypothetical protein